jgi:hypothetical protein
MKKSAFTAEQITYTLGQVDRGTPVAEGSRTLGVSEQTFSRGKRKCAGVGVAEWRRLRPLEVVLLDRALPSRQRRRLDPRLAEVEAIRPLFGHFALGLGVAGGIDARDAHPAARASLGRGR